VDQVSFGEWLKRQRKASGLTQEQLADQIGCAAITVRKIEAEQRRPSEQIALLLAAIFKISEEEHKSFLRFARGDWRAFVSSTANDVPWHFSNMDASPGLPTLITSFIGREKVQTRAMQLLNKYRLVTLTGSGGVGKTRLALEIGGQVPRDFVHGVWLMELADLSDPTLLLQTLARVFGVVTQPETSLIETLLNFLRTKTALVILDNCEHLLDACAALIDTLLKNCPNLKILATSREPLGIAGEAIYRVPSLGLPHHEQGLGEIQEFEAVRLFEDRAQLVQTDFSVTQENALFIAQICSRLDGIPLAIELAAAKAGAFSTREIAEQLETSFNLLTGGSLTDLPRQQTMRASISWSWNLLNEAEKAFMRQLSVFAGGWTIESAQAIGMGDVLSLIDAFVRKSLLVVRQETDSETRYHFHEVIRQYAREKLVEAGEEEDLCNRHLEYFRDLASQAKPYLRSARQLMWLDRLETELANIRAALVWASNGGSVQAGLGLVADLLYFWIYRSDVKENRVSIEKLLASPSASDDIRARAKGLLAAGYLAYFAGEKDIARTRLKADEVLWQELGDAGKAGLAEARDMLIDLDFFFDHNLEQVRCRYEDNLALCKESGDPWLIAQAIYEIAWVAELEGDFIAAQRGYISSVSQFRDQGDDIRACGILNVNLGPLAFKVGDFNKARVLLEEGLNIAGRTKHELFLDIPLYLLGVLATQERDYPNAKAWYTECLRYEQRNGETRQVARCFIGLASIMTAQNNVEKAVRLLAAAETQIETNGTWWDEDVAQAERERLVKLLPTLLDEETYATNWVQGRVMTLEQAFALAL
jgi:predicted ATPase/DNA-binding XRE family transcriptional regulator